MPNCPFIPAPKSPPKIILQIPPPITVPTRYGGSTGGIHCSGSLPTPCPPSRPRPQQVVQKCHFLLFDSSHGSPVHVCFNKKPKCKPCTAYKSLFIEKYRPQNTISFQPPFDKLCCPSTIPFIIQRCSNIARITSQIFREQTSRR